MVRGIGTAIMHGTTAALMRRSPIAWRTRELHHEARDFHFRLWWFVPGFFSAVAIHTTFNQFPSQPTAGHARHCASRAACPVGDPSLRHGEGAAVARCRRGVASRPAPRAGGGLFPRQARLAPYRRIGRSIRPQTGALIREYVTVLTRLILAEEEILLQQSGDTQRVETDSAALFNRFQDLRRRLGP